MLINILVMSAYSQRKVAELRRMCDDRNIDRRGLKKPQMIAALRDFDNDNSPGVRGDESDGHEEEMAFDEGGGGAASGSGSVAEFPSLTNRAGGEEPESVAVLKLKLALAEQQARWEKEKDEREREREERAREARERDWEIEQQRLNLQAQLGPTTPNVRASRADIHHLLPKMNSEDDVLNFFHVFERSMMLNRVEKCEWPRYLPGQLNAKANKVISGLTLQQNEDYDLCKRAVLDYYQLGAENYLKAFRNVRRSNNENFKMFKNKQKELLRYFIEARRIEDFDMLADAVLMEQFIESLPVDIRSFVISKQPNDSDQCSEYADLYLEMSRNNGKQSQQTRNVTEPGQNSQPRNRPNDGQLGTSKPNLYSNNKGGAKRPVCWNCGAFDHKFNSCPKRNASNTNVTACRQCGSYHAINAPCYYHPPNPVYATMSQNAAVDESVLYQPYVIPVRVNGVMGNAIRDSGNTAITFVDPSLVGSDEYTGNYVFCRAAFDEPNVKRKIPTAVIELASEAMSCPDGRYVEVGVSRMPPGIIANISNNLFQKCPDFVDIFKYSAIHQAARGRPSPLDHSAPRVETGTRQTGRRREAINQTAVNKQQATPRAAVTARPRPTNGDDCPDSQTGDASGAVSPLAREEADAVSSLETNLTPTTDGKQTETEHLTSMKLDSTEQGHASIKLTGEAATLNADVADCNMVQTRSMTRPTGVETEDMPGHLTDSDSKHDADSEDEYFRQLSQVDVSDIDADMEQPPVDETADKFRQAQRNDPTLAAWWQRAESKSGEFCIIDSLLYKVSQNNSAAENKYLLVLPQAYQAEILRIAHDSPYGAHLGRNKTLMRVQTEYFFLR